MVEQISAAALILREVLVGELISLERYRATRLVDDAPDNAPDLETDDAPSAPDPERFGWLVVEEDDGGRPIRWFHPKYVAQIGFVPQAPEWVFLDVHDQIRAWRALQVGELAAAMESCSLPEPEVTLNWDGTVIEPG